MGIELERAIIDFIHSDHVKKTFGNPMFVAVIIAIIIMLIMYFVVRDKVEMNDDSPKSFIMLAFTTGIYVLVATMGVMFVHNKVIQGSYEQEYENYALDETVAATIGSMETGSMAEVNSSVLGDTKLKPTFKDTMQRKRTIDLKRFLSKRGAEQTSQKKKKPKVRLPKIVESDKDETSNETSASLEEDEQLEEATVVDVSEESYEK